MRAARRGQLLTRRLHLRPARAGTAGETLIRDAVDVLRISRRECIGVGVGLGEARIRTADVAGSPTWAEADQTDVAGRVRPAPAGGRRVVRVPEVVGEPRRRDVVGGVRGGPLQPGPLEVHRPEVVIPPSIGRKEDECAVGAEGGREVVVGIVRQPAEVAAIRVHEVDLAARIARRGVPGERDPGAAWAEDRVTVPDIPEGQLGHAAPGLGHREEVNAGARCSVAGEDDQAVLTGVGGRCGCGRHDARGRRESDRCGDGKPGQAGHEFPLCCEP